MVETIRRGIRLIPERHPEIKNQALTAINEEVKSALLKARQAPAGKHVRAFFESLSEDAAVTIGSIDLPLPYDSAVKALTHSQMWGQDGFTALIGATGAIHVIEHGALSSRCVSMETYIKVMDRIHLLASLSWMMRDGFLKFAYPEWLTKGVPEIEIEIAVRPSLEKVLGVTAEAIEQRMGFAFSPMVKGEVAGGR